MNSKDLDWKAHAQKGICPVCGAKDGEWCYIKPGVHLRGSNGEPVGFHAIRVTRSIRSTPHLSDA